MQLWTQTTLLKTLSSGRCKKQFHLGQMVLFVCFNGRKIIYFRELLGQRCLSPFVRWIKPECELGRIYPCCSIQAVSIDFSFFSVSSLYVISYQLIYFVLPVLYFLRSQGTPSVLACFPAGRKGCECVGEGGAGPVLEVSSFFLWLIHSCSWRNCLLTQFYQ